MTPNEEKLTSIIYLLNQEVRCLRSVLSEWEEDKNCYVQMIRADDLRRVLESLGVVE